MLKMETEFPLQWKLSYAKGIQSLGSVIKDRIQINENEVQFLTKKQRRISDEVLLGAAEANSWNIRCSGLVQEIQFVVI